MRASVILIAIGTAVLGIVYGEAAAQYPNTPLTRARAFAQLRLRGTGAEGARLGPTATPWQAYRGAPTRTERLRQQFPLPGQQQITPRHEIPRSPVQANLEARNLLKARSLMGQRITWRYGKTPAVMGKPLVVREGENSSASPEPPTIEPAGESLEARLQRKADETFAVGTADFRDAKWTDPDSSTLIAKADNSFGLVRNYDIDKPRGYVADVFVSFRREYYNRATASLLRAVDLAKSPEDLKIERLYKEDDSAAKTAEFAKTIETINILATANPDSPQVGLLQAYFVWLNGEPAAARSALDRSSKFVIGEETTRRVAKLRAMLSDQTEHPASAPSPG
jgi:hypothetical protein